MFVYGWDAWALFWLTCFRTMLRARNSYPDLAGRPAVMASVSAAHFSHATAAMARTFASPGMTQSGSRSRCAPRRSWPG